MKILKRKGIIKIVTKNPSETKHNVRESIREGFRYVFADDLAVGEEIIKFSGRIWGLLINRPSFFCSIDNGKIYIEESRHSVSLTYSISYFQFAIMWTIVAIGMLITFFILYLFDIVPLSFLLSPLVIIGWLAVMIGGSIKSFESLLDECLDHVNGEKIRMLI